MYVFIYLFIHTYIQQVLISYPFYPHQCIHVNPNLPIHPTTPPLSPLGVHMFVLYNCISISALQTGSSEPFFFLDSIYFLSIRYLFFFLTSLCMKLSRSIYLTTNNSILFLLWLSNIPLCICATSSLSIYLSMGT